MKLHLAVSSPGFSPDSTVATTLCGLSNKTYKDDVCNCSTVWKDITCKKCLNIMHNPKNWKHRKYISKDAWRK